MIQAGDIFSASKESHESCMDLKIPALRCEITTQLALKCITESECF